MEHVIAAPTAASCARSPSRPATPSSRATRSPSSRSAVDGGRPTSPPTDIDLDHIRPDLAEVLQRHAVTLDAARPDAVARRRKTGQRTARENIDDLCDPGTFVEYGALVLAAQRLRTSRRGADPQAPPPTAWSPASAASTAQLFPDERARVRRDGLRLHRAGRHPGHQNHRKNDRMLELAARWRLPVVFFTEGGGGRPGRHRRSSRAANLDHAGRSTSQQAERPGAARRHQLGPLLRRQRRAARLLRRHHRHRRLQHRHGRPGDDRGRRPRRLPARGGRAR